MTTWVDALGMAGLAAILIVQAHAARMRDVSPFWAGFYDGMTMFVGRQRR